MSDLIDRRAALEAIRDCTDIFVTNLPTMIDKVDAQEALTALPTAEPKKGKWIDYTKDGYVECPFCHSATNCDGNEDELHFCFSCGAEMRGEEE